MWGGMRSRPGVCWSSFMRGLALFALLVAPALAEDRPTVRDEKLNFEISLANGDWESKPVEKGSVIRAQFETQFADASPPANARAYLMVMTLPKELRSKSLEEIAEKWRDRIESGIAEPDERKIGSDKLGGKQCFRADVRGRHGAAKAHFTWRLVRSGNRAYLLLFHRTNGAIDDEDVESELGEILASFRFLREETPPEPDKTKPAAGPTPLPKRERVREDHWRFECVKPEGFVRVKTLDDSERANQVVAKFDFVHGRERCLIRIYAHLSKLAKRSIRQLADAREREFLRSVTKPRPVQKDTKWKPPLARRTIHLQLTGRKKTTVSAHWRFAECRNGRQYQVEIYLLGATAEQTFAKEIAEFLESFTPFKK